MRLLTLLAALLAGCATLPAPDMHAFVVVGEQGAAVARVLTTAATCPQIAIDGHSATMQLRAAAGPAPARSPGAVRAEFGVLTCEASIPAGTASASVLGRPLPLPKAEVKRIVVIGDTGCRLAAKDRHFQDCNDPEDYPFARVAAAAAAWKPDLVVHVGDYHYREDPCPAGKAGCAGTHSFI